MTKSSVTALIFSSSERVIPLELRAQLSQLALQSIRHGVQCSLALPVNHSDWPKPLWETRASFVTLHKHDQLRGCIGSLTAIMPLAQDVSEHAYAAAFKDPRFEPVDESELDVLSVHLSVLSVAEPLAFSSEADLLEQIVPGQDGLILKERGRKSTFLPSVWEILPDRKQFLERLKQKAGLPPSYWSGTIEIERYSTESW